MRFLKRPTTFRHSMRVDAGLSCKGVSSGRNASDTFLSHYLIDQEGQAYGEQSNNYRK
jgi:hypothetical protein